MALQMGKPTAKVQRHTADALASTENAVHARLSLSSAQLATADDSLQHQRPAQHSTQYPHPWGLPTAAQSSQALNGTAASATSIQQQSGCRQVPSLGQPALVAAAPGMHQTHQLQASVAQQQQHAVSGTEAAAVAGWAEGWVEGASADQMQHKQPQQQQPLAVAGKHSAHHAAGMEPALACESGNPHAAYSADLLPSQQFWNQAAALSRLSQSQSRLADPAVAVRPSAAWFTNPAYTNAPSPMPSPERRPRSHPPPLPHPSQPAAPQPLAGPPQSYASTTYPSLPPSRPGTAHAATAVPADSNNSWGIASSQHAAASSCHAAQPASLSAAAQQWQQQQHSVSNANAPADARQQHAGNHQAGVPTFRPTFPSLPPRFTARPQTSTAAQHATHQPHAAQAQLSSQHTSHVGSPGHEGSPQRHQAPPMQQWHQLEAQLQQQHSKQQHKQQQPQEQQPQHGQHEQHDSSNHEAALLVKQLHQRVVAAEQDAAVARAEADDRVRTLEARVTLLEGRLKCVEGGFFL